MIATDNKTLNYNPIEILPIKRIGFKFNAEFVKLLSDRIKEAEKAGRGVNILIEGDLRRAFKEISSAQGEEYELILYDFGDIKIFNWDCDKAYNGKHKFYVEAFIKKKVCEVFKNE